MTRFFTLLFTALTLGSYAQEREEEVIQNLLNAWHKAAADADFDAYFGLMSREAVFVGTDAGEHLGKEEFMAFSKPYFDKGKPAGFRLSHIKPYSVFQEMGFQDGDIIRSINGKRIRTAENLMKI